MRLVSLVPLPLEAGSPAEGNGTGTSMMIQSCKDHGLKEPLFCPGIDQFKAINGDTGAEDAARDGRQTSEKQVRLGEDAVRDLLAKYDEMSVNELQEHTGLNKNQVRNRLRKLIAAGKIVPTAPASSRKQAYRTV